MADRPAALVLGGSGFVGRPICTALDEAGHEVTAVSRGEARLPVGIHHARADLVRQPADLARLLDRLRPRVVVNAAGAVWNTGAAEMRQANATAAATVVDAVAAAPDRPRLVHLGSVHEYGPVPPGRPLDEHTPARPRSPYGQSKLDGTNAVLAARTARRLDGVVLRLSNGVGPGAPRSSLLGTVAEQLARGADGNRPVVLRLAPLTARRDFIDVRDIADAVVAAAAAPRLPPPVLNIGRGSAVPVRELVQQLIAVSGLQVRLAETAPGGPSARGAGPEWQRVDITAATEALDWYPGRLLEGALYALWEESRCSLAR
ncbi:NAD-dependent epimerase/dehydratase family protein [Streptomyces sp. SID8379]|uniref:NAD-dependent epimerase/dehydratase family protein n=1 Tax=unclassified Streptomyces TaxID=2593676 RepID=UPI0003702BBC|nr:NAD(P)-dependent oxidoreductase [Streptomyces sp. HmicA12]MYW65832.1 NAD-dependent epimerase/dehydratase family protein [Streptomyces sp. SID8379]